jgi:hypothetical protein
MIKINEIKSVTKQLFSKSYWNKVNTVEFWAFSTKLSIIIPGLLFGKQWWWLYLFALISSLALILKHYLLLFTLILLGVVWLLLLLLNILCEPFAIALPFAHALLCFAVALQYAVL